MSNIKWLPLESPLQLEQLIEHSRSTPCIIFKHSTRCSLSSLAKHRLESKWALGPEAVLPYFLDLVAFREVSNLVEETFGLRHQSPQLLLIADGRCLYHASHLDIDARQLPAHISSTGQQ